MRVPGPTVLYVEDDEGDRFFMGHAFEAIGLGASLKVVTDGSTAMDYLSGVGIYADRTLYPVPKLVLLDLNLPQVSGFEVLLWIREHPQYATLPVVIFSSSSIESDRAAAKALGASDYYVKPNSGLLFNSVVSSLQQKWLSVPPASSSSKAGEASAIL